MPLLVIAMVAPATVSARSPQQELYAHLVEQARKSGECSRFPALRQYCNPSKITGSAKEAAQALRYMRDVERLGAQCAVGDSNACLRQGAANDVARKLGWCSQPSRGVKLENVILWARCGSGTIYTPKK